DQAAAHLNMAVIHSNSGDPEKAEAEYRTALRLDPQFVPARINLAMLCDQQGKKDEATRWFREVIELEPELAEAHYSLGLLLAEDETRLAEAAKSLAEAARLAPENPRIHYNYGLALQRLERPDDAERELTAAYKLAPGVPDYLNALAILYSQQGLWDNAIKCAEELVRRDPGSPQMKALLQYMKQGAAEANGP
ncbi:MAG TPA: tetratricopeptide repeat protein, partial [Thermoguttaceae bacterium]|nr:tetratricopeptide repeat protein [Thermoguttaceae bacterium]